MGLLSILRIPDPPSAHIKRAPWRSDKGEDGQNSMNFWNREETELRKTRIVGTIVGVFDGALDGVPARLVRRIQIGYTVELLESKGEFHKGDRLQLSTAEFEIHKGDVR